MISSIVNHLHEIVKETEPTFNEWLKAIEFLTKTGQKCDDKRQEFILLSDVLEFQCLLILLIEKNENETESTVLGPFHAPAPEIQLGDNIALHVKKRKLFSKRKGKKILKGNLFLVHQSMYGNQGPMVYMMYRRKKI